MTAKHSPGPYRVDKDEQVPERGAIYIHARGRYDADEVIGEAYKTDADVEDGTLEQTEANARLFGASPRLLEALKEWQRLHNIKGIDPALRKRMVTHAANLTRAAIAEAESQP
ncbi:MAG: hypothetical protein ACREB3_05330 [Burkholderiales bacterium]